MIQILLAAHAILWDNGQKGGDTMADRFRVPVAVMPLITRGHGAHRELLLHRRQNTGYADGLWDCAGSGHVDEGEPMTMAVVREAQEEVGLSVLPGDVRFATMAHARDPQDGTVYIDAYFWVESFVGEARICEPHKSAELAWFALDTLPDDLIAKRRRSIDNALGGVPFSQEGWEV